jgi:nuclear pore complex protein Nup53
VGATSPNGTNTCFSPLTPSQIDPFYTYGESIRLDEKLDETWITVFGFPPSATSYILQEFANYGQIVNHVPSTQGNWLHIQYQSKLQAQKALSKNGKILANSLMIGVMQCIDKVLMDSFFHHYILIIHIKFFINFLFFLLESYEH